MVLFSTNDSDGHGVNGHDVSGYIKNNLPVLLNHQLKVYKKENLNSVIEQSFLEINYDLHTNETFDTLFSGSTCVTIIYSPEKLITANVGDSRAVLGKCINGSKTIFLT